MAALGLSALLAGPLAAGETPKFAVDGTRLIYDTFDVPEDVAEEIEQDDAEALLEILQAHEEIETVVLNSSGGSLWAARRMADMIIDFELDTHIDGECASSCALVFLGGHRRTMSRGSRLGFHHTSWAPSDVESYYESEAEMQGWNTPFEFASWVYSDTQREIHEQLLFIVNRGVEPIFAIETMKTVSDGTWFPYRVQLLAAGVLTE